MDEVAKTKWVELLEGRTETYPTDHLTEAKRLWVSQNIPLLRTFYTIVAFLPVNLSKVLTLDSVIGVNDPTAYRQTMTKYFWM